MQGLPKNMKYTAALYMRLSKDDEGAGESVSITTQRKMLRNYAQDNHFIIYSEYVDDGVSGTTFERPAFKQMIQDIEDKKVNMVITKDLSRLGRDYILSGQYTEIYFPSKKVRYIAINDGYDSDGQYTDIAPFKNVINEMYARDISKKIRSAFVTKMVEGEFVGAFAPYGYKRDPNDKHHLVVDDVAADVVKEIFAKAAKGTIPAEIARNLNERKILTPIEYRCLQNNKATSESYDTRKEWTSGTITKLLRNIVYIGHMAQGKTTKISFKSDMVISNPENDWHIVKNTHEPIIGTEMFDLASRRSKQRTCKKKGAFSNVFSGIAKCADCGRNMSTVGTRKKGAQANLACGGYKLYGSRECSNHFIDYDVLYNMVLSEINNLLKIPDEDEKDILESAQIHIKKSNRQDISTAKIKDLRKRKHELDILVENIYEDHVKGVLSTERMQKMLCKYEAESNKVDESIEALETKKQDIIQEDTSEKLRKLLHGYTNATHLTPELLYRLVDRIEIGQGSYLENENEKVKQQTVSIYFRFTGKPMTKTYQI